MAVNLAPPVPAQLHPVPGVELGVAMAGVKKPQRRDLLVVRLAPGTTVAGVFTRNRFCAAPVVLAKKHLAAEVRALVVNTGNANAGTGNDGLQRALRVCASLAARIDCRRQQVLPFSTGVIMEPLPVERIVAAIPQALADLRADNWMAAAEAIMTTDTVAKAASRKIRLSSGEAVVTGIAKGSGMICPDMATLLGFIATDAKVGKGVLQRLTRQAAAASFNAITVDGDTSTNDAFVCLASGRGPEAR
ncbi:MAG: bifunctional ornithine acetyltransferase/N-acetylglutamate synthase, partial [Betaproteobacteria bacterium]